MDEKYRQKYFQWIQHSSLMNDWFQRSTVVAVEPITQYLQQTHGWSHE